MPKLITRSEAISRIEKEIKTGECLSCHLIANRKDLILFKGRSCTVMFSEFPRTWGQTMIILHAHKISFSEMEMEEWTEINEAIRKTSIVTEKILKPHRVFIARTGSSDNLLNTCPHIHFNIIPIYDVDQRSSDIFSWEHGLFSGEVEEWSELYGKMSSAWKLVD